MAPDLRELVISNELDPQRISVGLPLEPGTERVAKPDRHKIFITDGTKVATWNVPSLRALFRGQKQPPDLGDYPVEYVLHLTLVERSLAQLFDADAPRSDQEMEEIYATVRRRPDGRSLGTTHDWVWSFTAFMLGRFEVSQAEFEAVLQRLSVSARHFSQQPQSYNYAAQIDPLLDL